MKKTLKLLSLLTISGLSSVFASSDIQCPNAEQLSNLTVTQTVIPGKWYATLPDFVSPAQCAVALAIIAPSKGIAQQALGKAVLFKQEQESNITSCYYDKVPDRDVGLITVLTYLPVDGLCRTKGIDAPMVNQTIILPWVFEAK